MNAEDIIKWILFFTTLAALVASIAFLVAGNFMFSFWFLGVWGFLKLGNAMEELKSLIERRNRVYANIGKEHPSNPE